MAEQAKHTPGPWTFDFYRDDNDGYPVRHILAPNGCTLAALQHCADDAANARLIAAAPDLLAALREADRLYSANALLAQSGMECGRWINSARAAIARADGR